MLRSQNKVHVQLHEEVLLCSVVTYPGLQDRDIHPKALQLPGCSQTRHPPTDHYNLPRFLRCNNKHKELSWRLPVTDLVFKHSVSELTEDLLGNGLTLL